MKTNSPGIRCGCVLLAAVTLAASALRAQAPESARAGQGRAGVAVISSVAITQASQDASVRVAGEGRLEAQATRLRNPERLVLDFAGARLGVRRTLIPGVSAPVRGVRLGQFRPDVARVVIDLDAALPYQMERDGSAIVIVFRSASRPRAEFPAATSKASVPAAAQELRRVDLRFVSPAPRAAHSRRGRNSPRGMALAIPNFELPRELTQPSAFLASLGAKPAIPERPAQQSSNQGGNAAAVVQQTSGGPTAGKYSGEPISVNLKDVDLRDFFRLIHEISGLNVVLDPAVKGTLTIVLDEVPWDQALDIVLQNNGLEKQLHGNVLRIAARDTLKKEAEVVRDLQKAQSEAIDPVTVTRVLSYAKASTLKDTLKRFLTSRGEILADERSNQLIIRDIPATIPTVDNLIRQLDRKSQQVEIEARVVSASRSFARDIGVQLAFSGTTTSGRSVFGGNQNVGVSPIVTSPLPPPLTASGGSTTGGMPFAVNLPAQGPTSGLFFGHRSPNFALDFFISAAEAKGVGKLLSKPKVITQNNEKATVKQGTKIPIQTTINNTISIQYIDAVLRLEVTPQVTAEGTVFMDILVENTQIDNGIPRVLGIPALNTQAAETKVTVADGGTVVVGGIIVSQQRVDITEVPLVGSLPVIGHLFRRSNINNTAQELLFFVTPRIMPS